VIAVIDHLSSAQDSVDGNIATRLLPTLATAIRGVSSLTERVGLDFHTLRARLTQPGSHGEMEPLKHFARVARSLGITSRNVQFRYLNLLHEFATLFYWGAATREYSHPRTSERDMARTQSAAARLKNWTFKPMWIRDCIYAILRHANADPSTGLVSREEVKRVLRRLAELVRERFEADDVVEATMAVMAHFELSYALEEGRRFMVPAKLGTDTPDIGEWPDNAVVAKFDFLPTSVCQRLIVRMCEAHRVKNNLYWRDGVVVTHFDDPDCTALIMSPPGRLEISVQTRGGTERTRRDLEAIIEHEIEVIHSPVERVRLTMRRWVHHARRTRRTRAEEVSDSHGASRSSSEFNLSTERMESMAERNADSNMWSIDYSRDTAASEVKHLRHLLDLSIERIRYLERQEAITDGQIQRISIQQQLKYDLRPKRWQLEVRLGEALARAVSG